MTVERAAGWTVENRVIALRYVLRDGKPVLQYGRSVVASDNTMHPPGSTDWQDVPTVEDPDAAG